MPHHRASRVGLTVALSVALLAVPMAVATADAAPSAPAGDLLIDNYSFESGATGWLSGDAAGPIPKPTAGCTAAIAVSGDEHVTGANSLRLAAASHCRQPGVLSSAVAARAGEAYHGYVQARVSGRSGVRLRLVFRDAAGHVVGVDQNRGAAAPTAWTPLSVAGVAPSGASTVAVEIGLQHARPGDSAFIDDALLSARFTDLGPQIASTTINGATLGVDATGHTTGYVVMTGNAEYDARLIGIDAASGAVSTDLPLPGATGAWTATTASDGTVYVGSYNYDDPATAGRLYAYSPGADAVVDLGNPVPGDTFVWSVTAGPNGTVFGGTYPSGDGFKYTPGGGFQQLGDAPLIAPEQYARSVAYDPSLDVVYVGIGAHAHLMACPGGGATCTDILPAQYANEEFAYSVSAGDGYVFANMSPSGDGHLVVLKVTKAADGTLSATAVRDIPSVKYPGASPVIDGSVYYVGSNKLSRYDLATNQVTSLGMGLPVGPRSWGVDRSGATPRLVTMGSSTTGPKVVSYDIATNQLSTVTAQNLAPIPTDLQSIQSGPDGRIYSSGFRSGTVGVYTPMRSDQDVQRSGIGQAEGSTVLDGTIYWGTYPGAVVYGYHPEQPWKAGTNPKVVCTLTDQDQDRPYGMTSGGGKLYIGTEAGYGKLAGALSVYDPATGTCTTQKNIVPDETITSLAYLDGTVYGGTSIWGGLGVAPTQSEAKLLVVDTATGVSRTVPLPSRGLRAVLAVTVGPDHRIWMIAEDHLLVYDPHQQRFVVDKVLFPELNIPGEDLIDAHDAFLTVGRDGALYGTIHSSYLYRLDPKTLRVTILHRGNVHHVVQDEYGNLYYVEDGYRLHRLAL